MRELIKSSVVVAFAFGLVSAMAAPAQAQGFGTGSFTGTGGTFNTGNGFGTIGFGSGGIQGNTALGSFGFDLGGGGARGDMEGAPGGGTGGFASGATDPAGVVGGYAGSFPQGNGMGTDFGPGVNQGAFGPQGQAPGGYATGAGSGGSAFSSAGATGVQSRESGTTNNARRMDARPTNRNSAVYETQEQNLLSTFSVDPSSYPSGMYDYGFPSGRGILGTIQGALQGRAPGPNGSVIDIRRGWYLPQTSTGSVDINTVSP
jgi:hypothetical protein